MNILEAYIKKYKQLIILILGLPCTNKSEIAKELNIDLNISIIKINDFLIKDKYIEKEESETKFKIYEDAENYDWENLNKKVNKLKSKGLIIYGNFIDINKIDWDYDFSFFYSMNNTLCKKILNEKNLFGMNLNDNETESKINVFYEKIFFPIYEKLKENTKFNKFFNIKENSTFDESYDEIFDLLMDMISKKVH